VAVFCASPGHVSGSCSVLDPSRPCGCPKLGCAIPADARPPGSADHRRSRAQADFWNPTPVEHVQLLFACLPPPVDEPAAHAGVRVLGTHRVLVSTRETAVKVRNLRRDARLCAPAGLRRDDPPDTPGCSGPISRSPVSELVPLGRPPWADSTRRYIPGRTDGSVQLFWFGRIGVITARSCSRSRRYHGVVRLGIWVILRRAPPGLLHVGEVSA